MAAAFTALSLLKPAVAALVQMSPSEGRFGLEEIEAKEYPELVGCRLGNLHAENIHIVAVAQGDDVHLDYTTVVDPAAKLIVIYDRQITPRLRQEMRRVAAQAGEHRGDLVPGAARAQSNGPACPAGLDVTGRERRDQSRGWVSVLYCSHVRNSPPSISCSRTR